MASPALTCAYRNLNSPVSLLRTLASQIAFSRFQHKQSPRRLTTLSLLQTQPPTQTKLTSTSWNIEYNRLMPCPAYNYPPRIEHMVVLKDINVTEFISKQLDLPSL